MSIPGPVSARPTTPGRRRSLVVAALIVAAQIVLSAVGVSASASNVGSAAGAVTLPDLLPVAPNPVNLMDCNGWSPVYRSLKRMGSLCADPVSYDGQYGGTPGRAGRFYDNGHYVGHDEPSIIFESTRPGSGNHMTYYMQMPTDPRQAPTPTATVSHYAELSIAPWFGLAVCDDFSFTQNPCIPNSDSNQSSPLTLGQDAGSGIMELQFYPPGFTPFLDSPSCDLTRWCAALTIDSVSGNGNCAEPVNFSFLQTDGHPAGPPSPQLVNSSSFTPNSKTLMLNAGDVTKVSLFDTPNGLETMVDDLTTRTRGWVVASAANGFKHTRKADCSGVGYDFHPEFSTASPANRIPWAALHGAVLAEQEIGHFEACTSLANPSVIGGGGYTDAGNFQTCKGGVDGGQGEGPCTYAGQKTCANAATQPGYTCRPINPGLCEGSDGHCFKQGDRSIVLDSGGRTTGHFPMNGCMTNQDQNGDLDFDGTSYQPDWPNGSPNFPTSFQYIGPFDGGGYPYPQLQFETDVPGSEMSCTPQTGAGCTAPPIGANFYPFWSIQRRTTMPLAGFGKGTCSWNFGNSIPGTTLDDMGGYSQYGHVEEGGGVTLLSPILPNPTTQLRCQPYPTGPVHLGKVNVISGSTNGMTTVILDHPVTLTRGLGVDLGAFSGRFFGIQIHRQGPATTETLTAIGEGFCTSAGCPASTVNSRPALSQILTHDGAEVGSLSLPAGRYQLAVVADGPMSVTLTLDGLTGTRTIEAEPTAAISIADLPATVSQPPVAGETLLFAAGDARRVMPGHAGFGMLSVWGSYGIPAAASAGLVGDTGTCTYPTQPSQPQVAYEAHCPGGGDAADDQVTAGMVVDGGGVAIQYRGRLLVDGPGIRYMGGYLNSNLPGTEHVQLLWINY